MNPKNLQAVIWVVFAGVATATGFWPLAVIYGIVAWCTMEKAR